MENTAQILSVFKPSIAAIGIIRGRTVGTFPLTTARVLGSFVNDTLKKNGGRVVDISLADYKSGYCLYVFEPFGVYDTRVWNSNFDTVLPETVIVIVYSTPPVLMRVDDSRKLSLQG